MKRLTLLQTLISAPAAFFGLKLWKKEVSDSDKIKPTYLYRFPDNNTDGSTIHQTSEDLDRFERLKTYFGQMWPKRPGESLEWDGDPLSEEWQKEHSELITNFLKEIDEGKIHA